MGLNSAGLSASGGGSGGGGGSGTVTSVSVVSANGLAGTVANSTTTPAITLSTTITGILKGNGTAISAAVAGTDYVTPTGSGAGLTGIVVTFNGRTGAVTLSAADVESTFTAKGQLFAGTGSGTGDLVSTGTAGQVLTVGGADASGLEWTTPSGGTVVPSQYTTSTITADPNPGVIGTYYRTNYAASGNFTLPSSGLAAGDWIRVFQVAANTLTFVGTINGDTGYALTTQNQATLLIYNGTSWDAN